MVVKSGHAHAKAASLLLALVANLGTVAGGRCAAQVVNPFRYEDVVSLDDMKAHVRRDDPVGTPRNAVRAAFVTQGGGTLKLHPTRPGVEKYLYDVNLCRYYVWRWNVSADYDGAGRLTQLYVNSEPALPDGAPPGQKGAILKIARPRPEADRGETSLAAIVLDLDGDPRTLEDEDLVGAGPTRADPANLGRLHMYHVKPWRSIFDMDAAERIVPYAGGCAAAERRGGRPSTPLIGLGPVHRAGSDLPCAIAARARRSSSHPES